MDKDSATAINMAAIEKAESERNMRARMEWFFKKYQPRDVSLQPAFYADFHLLVREIYADANKPAHKLMEAIVQVLPNPLLGERP